MPYSGQEIFSKVTKEWCRILVGCSCSLQILLSPNSAWVWYIDLLNSGLSCGTCSKGCRGYWELGDHISTSVSILSSTSSTILKASEEALKEVRETDCQR